MQSNDNEMVTQVLEYINQYNKYEYHIIYLYDNSFV